MLHSPPISLRGHFAQACSILALATLVRGQTLAEFALPGQATVDVQIETKVSVKTEIRGALGSVVAAPAAQDAARSAAQALVDLGEGVQLFSVGNGVGVLAGATVSYNPEVRDPRRQCFEQRQACLTASLRARQMLLEYHSGLSLEGRTAMAEAFEAADTNEQRSAAQRSTMSESLRADASGLVRGAVVYKVEDRKATGEVFVSLLCTPGSLRATEHGAGASAFATAAEADAWLRRELGMGTLPPDGAYRLHVRETGMLHWVGVGAGVAVSSSSNAQLQRAARGSAMSIAKRRAQKSLLVAMQGGQVAASDQHDERFASFTNSLEDLVGGNASVERGANSASSSSQAVAEAYKGELPGGFGSESLQSQDGRWVYAIYTFPPLKTASSSRPITREQPANNNPQPPASRAQQDPQGSVPECRSDIENGLERALVTSTAPDRRVALKLALLEGIERINGVKIEGSSAVKQQYRDAVVDLNGKIDQVVEMESSSKDEVYTEANGLIQDFKVLKESRTASGEWELSVCVTVPVFDPARPRPGKRATVAILPAITADPVLSKFAEEIVGEVMQGLVGLEGYTILERQHLKSISSELAQLKAGVASGSMNQTEMVKIGQMLSADYLVVGSLQDLSHERWEETVLGTKEPRESLAIKSSLRLVNVATSEAAVASEYENSWDFMELVRLPPSEAKLSRQTFACRAAVSTHLNKVRAGLVTIRVAATPRVLFVDGDEIAIECVTRGYRVGNILNVYGVRRIKSSVTGKEREIRRKKGAVKITRIDTGESLIYASILPGQGSNSIKEGDACQRR